MGLNLNKLNMIQRAASLLLLLVVVFVFEAVHATEITSRAFNVVDFGAVGDGKTDLTKAIMSAWTEACNSTEGRPRLLIPQGTFFVGPVTFKGPCKGPMVVQLQGVLKASPNLADYDSDNWVVFKYIDGLVITGGGTFDGQGVSAWPHNHITAPGDNPNTDGIHISNSYDISIARLVIATGDDCVSLGSGRVNISISNVVCGPATVSMSGASGTRDFTFEDIVMKDVYNLIIIDQHYCPYAKCNNKSVPCKNIELSDIDLTYNGVREDATEAVTAICLNVNGISSGKQNPPSILICSMLI
ncbi:hypothetical protein QJS10_CPB19g00138 [Acorus calamus]|uniref:Polygalacturonase n=1 Tax=Acorus calamus TaxID=4465 RepID=A0AAV9CJ06_ACOCL|nr:hypothetical protein QJS10_CPB19g00138 [Acorus calamus]